jgi:phosphoglycolate phosphatase-like HAD superfamily hydrolase
MSYIPFLKDMLIEPHLKTVLQKLKPRYKTGVATNRTDTMNRVLHTHGLEGMFDLVVTALDVEHPKPHPDQLVKLLGHFALKPDQMLYIGDSTVDQMAAAAAGVDLAAYDNPELSARYHIQGLDELKTILNL